MAAAVDYVDDYWSFHLVNYLGSCVGGTLLSTDRMTALLDWTIEALRHDLEAEPAENLARVMAFPISWDPYFKPTMSLLDVYHFGTQRFDHHLHQLTLNKHPGSAIPTGDAALGTGSSCPQTRCRIRLS